MLVFSCQHPEATRIFLGNHKVFHYTILIICFINTMMIDEFIKFSIHFF